MPHFSRRHADFDSAAVPCCAFGVGRLEGPSARSHLYQLKDSCLRPKGELLFRRPGPKNKQHLLLEPKRECAVGDGTLVRDDLRFPKTKESEKRVGRGYARCF